MSIRRLSLIATSLAAIASAAAAAPPLTAQGWGKLRIGMRERDAVRLFHLRTPKGPGPNPDGFICHEDELPSREGLYVMVERGVVTRITIEAPVSLLTDKGLGIGATEDEVKRAYGPALKIHTAPYLDEPAHELDFWTAQGTRGVRYDTNAAGAVEAIYVGGHAISYIEGCS
jgi:hypothetical protein